MNDEICVKISVVVKVPCYGLVLPPKTRDFSCAVSPQRKKKVKIRDKIK